MNTIPSEQGSFRGMILGLFPRPELCGVIIREIQPHGGSAITVVYVKDLMPAGDLERLVLTPLAREPVHDSPEILMRSGRIPAPQFQSVRDSQSLASGLLEGLVAVHVDGYGESLLVGGGKQAPVEMAFGPDLDWNVTNLRQQLRRADLHAEHHVRDGGGRVILLYLKRVAAAETVRAVRSWSLGADSREAGQPWWRALLNGLRLPPALESTSLPDVAAALTEGYVCVLKEGRREPLVVPATLERLFRGAEDASLTASLRRIAPISRVVAAGLGLTLSATLVAVSAYHHGLIPGPFLVAMGTSRTNLPLPVVGEMVVVALLGDAFQAAGARVGIRNPTTLTLAAFILALMAMMQVGVIGAVSGSVGILEGAVRAILPNPALQRSVRLWRYFFIGGAAGLGVYGMTLVLFTMMIYLGEERAVSHPIRLPPSALRH